MKNYFVFFRNYIILISINSLFIFLVTLQGCSFPKNTNPEIYLETAYINLDLDANNNSATSVDIVLVYNTELLNTLTKLNSQEYFATLEQLKNDYPEMSDIWHWELTPGQSIKDLKITNRFLGPIGAFVFASYYTPGPHRIRIGSSNEIHILLKKNDFCIVEQGCLSFDKRPEKLFSNDLKKKEN